MPRKDHHFKGPLRKRVYFKLRAPGAEEVILCGSFNNWETHSHHLKRDKKGVWRTYLSMEPGIYEYRFLVDGQWQNDPEADVMPNAVGSQNCLQVVI